MKKWLFATLLLLFAAVGAAMFLRTEAPPPAGFVSIRAAPAFQDPAMLERAWALPVARLYPRPLVAQSNPSSCGPTSVSNVFKSTGGVSTPEDVAEHGAGCLAGICFGGLTLTQLAEAARTTAPGWVVTELRPERVEGFREALRHANEPQQRLIINFTRAPLFGGGGGHHSPIGGYLEAEDLVFVLDVNDRFGPWLVSSARLFEAMDTVDSSSGAKRGLLLMIRQSSAGGRDRADEGVGGDGGRPQ